MFLQQIITVNRRREIFRTIDIESRRGTRKSVSKAAASVGDPSTPARMWVEEIFQSKVFFLVNSLKNNWNSPTTSRVDVYIIKSYRSSFCLTDKVFFFAENIAWEGIFAFLKKLYRSPSTAWWSEKRNDSFISSSSAERSSIADAMKHVIISQFSMSLTLFQQCYASVDDALEWKRCNHFHLTSGNYSFGWKWKGHLRINQVVKMQIFIVTSRMRTTRSRLHDNRESAERQQQKCGKKHLS